MALTITHPFVSAVVDENNPGEVGPGEWNEAHSLSGTFDAEQMPALTGDVTTPGGSLATTLATVNGNVGTFGSATQVAQVTYNAKGLATAVTNVTVTPAASSITGGASLTKTDDTNVTLTLGGSAASALLAATSITVGWTGTLDASRGGTGISALGTGIATWLGTPSSANLASAITDETGSGALVFATSPVLVTPNLGTPSAVTLTNGTGLPIATGVSGLGSGVATFLATPSSANLAAAVTGETGTGALMFGTSPTITTDITIPNEGLHLLDTDASHDLVIKPGSNLSTDRILTITTGDAARTLDISAASVTVSSYGATLIDDADASTARTTLGLGTAATVNTGTSGATIPLLNAINTWSDIQFFTGTTISAIRQSGGALSAQFGRADEHGSSQALFAFDARGRTSTPATRTYGSFGHVVADNTAGSEDSYWQFDTSVAGARADRLQIGGGLYHPSATGTDKGNNTINFGAVYDDNTLLTDYVFDKFLGREPIDYSRRVQAKYDELDPAMFSVEAFTAFWKQNRRLYGMPDLNDCINGIIKEYSLGDMIQKLMQVVELQAVHIAELNDSIKRLQRETA